MLLKAYAKPFKGLKVFFYTKKELTYEEVNTKLLSNGILMLDLTNGGFNSIKSVQEVTGHHRHISKMTTSILLSPKGLGFKAPFKDRFDFIVEILKHGF